MTPTPPKFVVKIPEKHITEKIEHSAKQCADMEFREILCPYVTETYTLWIQN